LTGFQGGKLKDLVDLCLVIPSNSMEQIEDVHLVIDHILTISLK
jgi:D-sedoheptulose 7-phosphate isomerase